MGNIVKLQLIALVCLALNGLVHSFESDYPKIFQARMAQVVKQITENETLNSYAKNDMLLKTTEPVFDEFPCPELLPSDTIPTTVHELRPGDIKVIAAIGDSLTTGRGAGGNSVVNLLFDYRGLSWSIGGDETYKEFPSLPNILKVYNPDLYGYATCIGKMHERLDVAVIGATSMDIRSQALRLINKLENDQNVDFDNDWKLVTLFIGGNDLCESCKDDFTPESYISRIKDTLDLLQEKVPRTFVNLVEILDVEIVRTLRKGPVCDLVHRTVCQCASFPNSEEDFDQVREYRMAYQDKVEELIDSGRYDEKVDFTVVLQPFYLNTTLPMKPNGGIDYSYFAADCFHYTKKGQMAAGIFLWNNMLEPVGNKSSGVDFRDYSHLLCPTNELPYLYTRLNSQTTYQRQSFKDQQEEFLLSSSHIYTTVAVFLVAFVIGGLAIGIVVSKSRKWYRVYKYEQL